MGTQTKDTQMTKRHLYSDDITEIIKKAISQNKLRPGDRIVETRLAKELGISQAPVREAIRELIALGLVESRPYQGAFVKIIDRQEIFESYDVRIALETQAMQNIANHISEDQIIELQKRIDAMHSAGAKNNFEEFIECDRLFHYKILQFNGNKLLIKLWEQCKIMQNSKIISITARTDLKNLADRHNLLLSALRGKDKTTIENEMSCHFQSLLDDLNSLQKTYQA